MATRTIARLYDTHEAAAEVVRELEGAGIPNADISLVTNNRDNQYAAPAPSSVPNTAERTEAESKAASGAGTGATTGAVLGGGAGLLAGLGMLAIPGVGPVVAAGWLVATLAGAGAGAAVGAAAGGLVGSLTAAGVPEREAHVYAEGVRRGSSLVTVRTDEPSAARVEAIMARHQPVDWQTRDRDYRGAGWTGFDPDAPAYTGVSALGEPPRTPTSGA
ncbi:MAG: hypothetical protein JOZ58_00695 [Acetobacteraceae bacterium]|nr:hypothetical protein [Acetobacteraceae bacterium]